MQIAGVMILSISISFVVSTTNAQNGTSKEGLAGPVRSVHEEHATLDDIRGEVGAHKDRAKITTTVFDRDGREMERIFYSSDGTVSYRSRTEYSPTGLRTRDRLYDGDAQQPDT